MMTKNPFTDHPASVDETYTEHLCFASSTGLRMVTAGLACMVHGIFPFLCVTTGSRTIVALNEKVTAGARAATAESHRQEIDGAVAGTGD